MTFSGLLARPGGLVRQVSVLSSSVLLLLLLLVLLLLADV